MHIAVEGFMKRGFREFLCSSSSGVFLTYISLKDYKNLKEVPTSLHLTPENQKYFYRQLLIVLVHRRNLCLGEEFQ